MDFYYAVLRLSDDLMLVCCWFVYGWLPWCCRRNRFL